MIDIFSVKTWEFSEKEKEARTKAVIPEVEAVSPEPAKVNIPRAHAHARSSEAEEVKALDQNQNNTHARSSEPPPPETPKQKKSFYDIGIEIVGERCNGTRSGLIAEMMQRYSISETRANEGFNQLVSSKIIELQTNVNRYYMTHSTPF